MTSDDLEKRRAEQARIDSAPKYDLENTQIDWSTIQLSSDNEWRYTSNVVSVEIGRKIAFEFASAIGTQSGCETLLVNQLPIETDVRLNGNQISFSERKLPDNSIDILITLKPVSEDSPERDQFQIGIKAIKDKIEQAKGYDLEKDIDWSAIEYVFEHQGSEIIYRYGLPDIITGKIVMSTAAQIYDFDKRELIQLIGSKSVNKFKIFKDESSEIYATEYYDGELNNKPTVELVFDEISPNKENSTRFYEMTAFINNRIDKAKKQKGN